jgi:hypothetical protein
MMYVPSLPPFRFLRVAACAILICSIGCKRPNAQSTSAPSPTTTSTTHAAPTQPTTQRLTLTINGSPITFPPAELHLTHTGNAIVAQLNTIGSDADSGNAIHFDVVLEDIDDPTDVSGAEWRFKADDNAERADTLNAITLDGRAVIMEPADVRILFTRDEHGLATIEIQGQFQLYDPPDSPTPQKTVTITGKFPASIR